MSFCIDYIGEKRMKVVSVNGSRYYISSRDDEINIAHELARKGFSIAQISQILGVSERQVKKYMSECW
jgi:predicted transcriptional regulator